MTQLERTAGSEEVPGTLSIQEPGEGLRVSEEPKKEKPGQQATPCMELAPRGCLTASGRAQREEETAEGVGAGPEIAWR